jgi:hypothetical protein
MIHVLLLTLVLTAAPTSAATLSCETRGDIRHCWDDHGDTVVTEQRSGDYVHAAVDQSLPGSSVVKRLAVKDEHW